MQGEKQLENEQYKNIYIYVKYYQNGRVEYIFVHFWRSLFLVWLSALHFMFF